MKPQAFTHIQWVFFDLGNTLIDETEARNRYLKDITARLRKEDIAVCPLELECRLADAFKTFAPYPWQSALTEITGDSSFSREVLSEVSYPKEWERPYPGAWPLLAALADRGLRIGVIANQSTGTQDRLTGQGLWSFLSCCISSAEVGISKPDPRIFELAEAQAQCPAQGILMVGDRIDNDIRPANCRGWVTLRVLQGHAQQQRPRDMFDEATASCTTLEPADRLWAF
jgi:8-oxo-dGTP diphosphatase/putative hydrolase of the HAD superfamily